MQERTEDLAIQRVGFSEVDNMQLPAGLEDAINFFACPDLIGRLQVMDHDAGKDAVERLIRVRELICEPDGQLHIIDFGKPVTWYGKILGPLLHKFEEANDNIDGKLPEIFGAPGLKTEIVGNFWTFFGDQAFLRGEKLVK